MPPAKRLPIPGNRRNVVSRHFDENRVEQLFHNSFRGAIDFLSPQA
jgi:hypothetical protein